METVSCLGMRYFKIRISFSVRKIINPTDIRAKYLNRISIRKFKRNLSFKLQYFISTNYMHGISVFAFKNCD